MKVLFEWLSSSIFEIIGKYFVWFWQFLKNFLVGLYGVYVNGVSGLIEDKLASVVTTVGGAAQWESISGYLAVANVYVPVSELFAGFGLLSAVGFSMVAYKVAIKLIPGIG